MASEHRFEIEPQQDESSRPSSKWGGCLKGCLIAVAIAAVILLVFIVWVARNLREWAAQIGTVAVTQGIEASDLPPQEKVEVEEQVGRVDKAFRNGDITYGQAGEIVQKVMESPLMPTLVVGAVDKHYFERSKLSDEEKAQGRLVLKRFARGIVDKKIDDEGIDAVMSHVADHENGSWRLRTVVSDDELRAALAEAKTEVDAAGIAAEPVEIDPSDELKRIIDESMHAN
jgi:hypothetical protein